MQTTAAPFPSDAQRRPRETATADRGRYRRVLVPERHQSDPEAVEPAHAEPVDERARGEAADRQPEAAGADEDAEPDVPPSSGDLREDDLRNIDRCVAEHDDVPGDEDGQERGRTNGRPEPSPMSCQWPRSRSCPPASAGGNPGEQNGGEEERHRVQPVGEIGALNRDQDPADDRATIHVRLSPVCSSEVAFGSSSSATKFGRPA